MVTPHYHNNQPEDVKEEVRILMTGISLKVVAEPGDNSRRNDENCKDGFSQKLNVWHFKTRRRELYVRHFTNKWYYTKTRVAGMAFKESGTYGISRQDKKSHTQYISRQNILKFMIRRREL